MLTKKNETYSTPATFHASCCSWWAGVQPLPSSSCGPRSVMSPGVFPHLLWVRHQLRTGVYIPSVAHRCSHGTLPRCKGKSWKIPFWKSAEYMFEYMLMMFMSVFLDIEFTLQPPSFLRRVPWWWSLKRIGTWHSAIDVAPFLHNCQNTCGWNWPAPGWATWAPEEWAWHA